MKLPESVKPTYGFVTKDREYAKEFTGGVNESSYNLIEEEGPRKGEKYQLIRL